MEIKAHTTRGMSVEWEFRVFTFRLASPFPSPVKDINAAAHFPFVCAPLESLAPLSGGHKAFYDLRWLTHLLFL